MSFYLLIFENLKRSRDTFLSGMHACTSNVLLCANQHTKLEVPNFTDSKDVIEGPNFLKRVT